MLHTRKPMTEETAAEMAARNERRREIVKRVLGDKYAHHPAHHIARKEPKRAVQLPTFVFVENPHLPPGVLAFASAGPSPASRVILRG